MLMFLLLKSAESRMPSCFDIYGSAHSRGMSLRYLLSSNGIYYSAYLLTDRPGMVKRWSRQPVQYSLMRHKIDFVAYDVTGQSPENSIL